MTFLQHSKMSNKKKFLKPEQKPEQKPAKKPVKKPAKKLAKKPAQKPQKPAQNMRRRGAPSASTSGETVKPAQASSHFDLNLQASVKTLGEPRKRGGFVLALVIAVSAFLAACYIRYGTGDCAKVEAELRMKMSHHV